jgi:arginase family enzyme
MQIALIAVPYDSGRVGHCPRQFERRRNFDGPRCWGKIDRLSSDVVLSRLEVRSQADLDHGEGLAMHASEIRRVGVRTLRQELPTVLTERGVAGETAYVHVDLDVLDSSVGLMNEFSTPEGLAVPELQWAIAKIADGALVRAASLTAFDPASDATGNASRVVVALAVASIEAVTRSSRSSRRTRRR